MIYKFAAVLALAASATATVLTVTVGQGGLVFTPPNTNAQNGDIVNFKFTGSPGNHTVSQAAFAAPCAQLAGGFDSGYVFIPGGFTGTTPEWNLTITDNTKPIWFYCKQTKPTPHCLGGMVGAINAPTTGNTIDSFKSAAMALSTLPTQTPGSLTGVGAVASAPPAPLDGGASLAPSPTGVTTGSGSATAASAAPSGASTSPAAAPSQSGSAVTVNAGSLWLLLAGLLGVALA
ncbi:hypothetical protein BU17DRAFT_50168 [Hysterangium stoloniferum]|nr:hypothetical protein BU17DRAFT_50168 [Hysterangium stoloniferum]